MLRLEELVAFLQAAAAYLTPALTLTLPLPLLPNPNPNPNQAAAAYLTPADPPNFLGVRSIARSLKGTRACCS